MGLFSDLRQRRLFQIVAGYAAAGWVVLEVVDQLADNSILPRFLYSLTLIWYVFGLLAAIVVGWFHGERGAQRAPVSEIVLLSLIGLLVFGTTGMKVRVHYAERAELEAAAASTLDVRRIAVTYFEDMRPGDENQHIADALTEELILQLSRVRSLDVISANGVAPFRGVAADSIGRTLRSGTVIGGAVEQVGDSVRISVRVHDGESGDEMTRRRITLVRSISDLLTARQEVVEETALALREWLGEEFQLRQRERDTRDVMAWALVQRAERARKDAEELIHQHETEAGYEAFDRADELLARAEVVDPTWAAPPLLRARIEYRRSRLTHDPHDAEPSIRTGLDHADRALRLDATNAEALEVRGTLKYWWHLLALTPDAGERNALLTSARADLEEAVRLDPTLAGAYSTLSHLYARTHDMSSSVLAAQRAYEEDAYLETADVVLWRLVTGLYDQQSFEQSQRWCSVGSERFPQDYRFAQCSLLLMTTRAQQPDVEQAWRLLERVDSLTPAPLRAVEHARSLIFVGGVLSRAGLADSADAVLRQARSQFRPEVDPERDIYLNEAGMRAVVLGDIEGAIDLLKIYAAANPDYDLEHGWWWRDVRSHPRYAELAAFQRHH